jgi:predicted TIM-barrel fold metal-dependent hydrolase
MDKRLRQAYKGIGCPKDDMTAPTITPAAPAPAAPPPPPPSPLAPARREEYNRLELNFRKPIPRPPVRGAVIDFHTHLLAARHAPAWFEAADHYGIDKFVSMTPLEEAVRLQRDWPGRIHFIAIPRWGESNYDEWLRRIDAFYNLGSRIVKLHMAPGTMHVRKYRLDSPQIRRIIDTAVARGMIIMTHIGDPETWYQGRYNDPQKFGTREDHYKMWEDVLATVPDHPWVGAHLGGNPENLPRLQSMLDRFPNLYLDNSATRWMVREISLRRDAAREFFIRNQDRILFGSDQVSGDDRGFDFLASRFWAHRKLWETAYIGPSPILDPDLPPDAQPEMRGLALPDAVLQKLYHDNAVKLMKRVGVDLE